MRKTWVYSLYDQHSSSIKSLRQDKWTAEGQDKNAVIKSQRDVMKGEAKISNINSLRSLKQSIQYQEFDLKNLPSEIDSLKTTPHKA